MRPKIAVLDDYQGVALKMADWSKVTARAQVDVFTDHLADSEAVAKRLYPYDIVCVMRERTPLGAPLIERLPNLKLIASLGAGVDHIFEDPGLPAHVPVMRPTRGAAPEALAQR